ncbi:MAG: alpha/beta hydrolase [Chitinophagales bacterium]
MKGQAISSDHAVIHYTAFGVGAPVLIINGGPGMNSKGFEGLAREIAAMGFTAIIYDQRGTGDSKLDILDSTTITTKLMADDIEAIRQKQGYQQWAVLGHSYGGMLASFYATQHPNQLSHLILSSSGGIDLDLLSYIGTSIPHRLSEAQRAAVLQCDSAIAAGDTTRQTAYRRATALAAAYVVNPKFIPVIAERLLQGNPLVNALIWQDMQRIGFDCEEGLGRYRGPVLIIQGKDDIILPKTAYKSKAALPQAKVIFVEASSHYGWLDQSQTYLGELRRFLSR